MELTLEILLLESRRESIRALFCRACIEWSENRLLGGELRGPARGEVTMSIFASALSVEGCVLEREIEFEFRLLSSRAFELPRFWCGRENRAGLVGIKSRLLPALENELLLSDDICMSESLDRDTEFEFLRSSDRGFGATRDDF